jgi:hypothetical protein
MERLLGTSATLALALLHTAAFAAAPALTIRDTIGRAWSQEPIVWQLPKEAGTMADGPVKLQRDGQPIPGQWVSAPEGPRILFVVEQLAADGATSVTAEPGQPGMDPGELKVTPEGEALVLQNARLAVRILNRNVEKAEGGEFSPVLGVRLPSGAWTGSGRYVCGAAKPVGSRTEVLERGPVRLAARVTTTFDNGRTHACTVTLWAGSRSVELDETFDVGPADQYAFKPYGNDRDELAWEWWSWYGDREGDEETHVNNWVLRLDSPAYAPREINYYGQASTDSDKGPVQPAPHGTASAGYPLANARDRRFEKYLAGHTQWRPDAVLWYLTAPAKDDGADALALYTHSARLWRNPNRLPTPTGITLRTGVNDLRIVSRQKGQQLEVECPLGLGRRAWAIRVSNRGEMLAPAATSPTALDAERVQRCMGLDLTRQWVTDWTMNNEYPRLFVRPEERTAYYARLKGNGIGSPGNVMDTFLRHQDQASFDKDYALIEKQAEEMIRGYTRQGMDNTVGYPGWMLGYWHAIIVAGGVDNLCGTAFCTPGQARALKKKLAILTYAMVSPDAWPDKQVNYGWGSMNMPVGRWGGRVVAACALSDHPMAREWLRDAGRYFRMLLETEYAPDGSGVSCPHYIGASSTSFFAWIAMANSGLAEDMSKSPVLQKFARYYMQLMKPADPRWGIRVLLNEGDTRPGSSPMPAILARFFQKTDPELAGQLMQLWFEGGRDLSLGMGIADALLINPELPPRPLRLGPQVNRGFGAFLRYRELGTPEEAYLAFVGGDFMIDHANTDQFGFAWNEKGVPLTDFSGALYQPMNCSAVSHSTIAWDLRPGGDADPGKGQPGNWYHDRNQPFVDLGGKTPRLHWEIGCDRQTQRINEIRGLVTLAADAPEAALLEGRVTVKALTEIPTRPDNYAIAIAAQAWPPATPLAQPFTWTRRLLYVKAPKADGMNYLVVRDDFGGFAERTPNFSYWSFGESVDLQGAVGRIAGQFGVDQDMTVLVPAKPTLSTDQFVHDQCEPIVSGLHREKTGKTFSEKQVLCRAEGQKGQGFLVVLFPYRQGEPRPTVEPWLGEAGAKVTWQGETHYVLLDTREHDVDAAGVKGRASCVVLKQTDAKNWSLTLPAGGTAKANRRELSAPGPTGLIVADNKPRRADGRNLLSP